MAGVLPPILKGVYVCDDVIGNPVGGKPMIVNLWNATRVPVGVSLPYTLKKLCVFACLRGGRGRSTFRVEVVRTDTGHQICSRSFEADFVSPNTTVYARLMLEDITFPVLGEYTVELFCNGRFFDDQSIQVLPTGV